MVVYETYILTQSTKENICCFFSDYIIFSLDELTMIKKYLASFNAFKRLRLADCKEQYLKFIIYSLKLRVYAILFFFLFF